MAIPPGLRRRLWPHQKKALTFATPFLRDPAANPKVALLRLPTGTGKTGIVATLAIADAPAKWTLVLTPWSNLCKQMVGDLKADFWKGVKWAPPAVPKIRRLLPSNMGKQLAEKQRLVLVATFATITDLRKKHRAEYAALASKLGEVIVDEGHYEPAAEWGQAVKGLGVPTLILTATPYRNDLKLFGVPKEQVFHFTHEEAEDEKIIRKLIVRKVGANEPQGGVAAWCAEFAKFWRSPVPKSIHATPKAILCCKDWPTIENVVNQLRANKIHAVGIHERFAPRRSDHWLVDVPDTKKSEFEVWVHQNKMTEGLDNAQFCVLGILNRIRNDRKLVQQIGRVLRRKKGDTQPAILLYSDDLKVDRSWNNYREFETDTDMVDPKRYHIALAAYLQQQRPMEYFSGKFRPKFDPYSPDVASEVRLRSSAAIRRAGGGFSMEEFITYTSDELLLADRILLGPQRDVVKISPTSGVWIFAIVANSEILTTRSLYEIRLGALAYALHGNLLFLSSTDDLGALEYTLETTQKLSSVELGRVFGKNLQPREVGLSNPWPAGPAIRRAMLQAHNLSATPAQLTDSVMVCGSVRASSEDQTGQNRRHYLGFKRSRITEQLRSLEEDDFGMAEFTNWSQRVAAALDDKHRKIPTFFKRYLQPIPPPAKIVPKYVILNFDAATVSVQTGDGKRVEIEETVVQANPLPKAPAKWSVVINYVVERTSKVESAELELSLDAGTSRFRFHANDKEDGAKLFVPNPRDEPIPLARFLNQHDDTHFISLEDPDVYYGDEQYFEIDYSDAEDRLTALLTPLPALERVVSEKGLPTRNATRWAANTVFGSIIDPQIIGKELGAIDLMVCDDMETEAADFVAVAFNPPRIIFIHAKHSQTRKGNPRKVAAGALHEVVSQAQKNLSHFVRDFPTPKHVGRWTRAAKWPNTKISRWLKGGAQLPEGQALWAKIREDVLRSPQCESEVWLVLGKSLNLADLKHNLGNNRTTETGQVLHILFSLNAACTQVGSRLRVFCH